MITEALVGTWLAMCAVMLYSDPRLWIVLASSVAFTLVRVAVVPLVGRRVKAFGALSPGSQLLWSNTAVSMLHSALSSLLALYALSCDHSLAGDYVNRASRAEFVTTAISTGYFAYDLWDYVLNRLYVKAPGIVAHHVVILICYISALTKTVGVPLLSLALICELHSACMHLRKLLSMSSFSVAASPAYKLVWQLQWATFLLARVVPHVFVTWITYNAYRMFVLPLHFWMAFVGMLFINILNAQLLRDVNRAFRKDFGYSASSASTATTVASKAL
ncbi:hypothetical protein PybrP1_009079 [[Pythium] brassicae (nom. inval.)]|nr:hypothetical protein PybrP1_009079 [[Pythium] brassicae (nom. inval.)]